GEAATDVPSPDALPDELAMRREMLAAVDALERRIPKQIAALRAVYLDGHTYLEAAASLGIAEGTAKSNVHKAIASLHASLTASEAA
ncbi:MAG TPA: sigma factor-like helix-turn-helix DNA-binding protein, partial [Patescibacteria group bacterium]|nr:sigma factor-like helix-turn-helix DNA-binding protein [Patescibacteria group bacterium]